MKSVVSDEILQAFVDGELAVPESEALVARMREDSELAQRVCSLRSLKSMVRLAYARLPAPAGGRRAAPRRRLVRRCAFGCFVLAAGIVGWALRGADIDTAVAARLLALPEGYRVVSLAREADPNRVLLHLDSAAPDRMRAVLDRAEWLLDEAERERHPLELEIVANSRGIELLRAGHSPYAERMRRMKQRHVNLQWVACGRTIARYASEGQRVELLPSTRTAPTAIGEIVTRLQQGWTYIRV
ncbi:MAG: hypothetical protein ACYC5S_09670 [Thiobacillus sp.]